LVRLIRRHRGQAKDRGDPGEKKGVAQLGVVGDADHKNNKVEYST